MQVTAIKSFDHNGKVRRGDVLECSEIQAKALKRAGLVEYDEDLPVNPSMAACIPPSALHPVLPSPQTIVKPSYAGAKRGRKKKGP